MSKSDLQNYVDWLRKAEEDEFAGIEIMKAERFYAPACFHFQQMAEKYLKALLIFCEKRFPKVHDLLELETLIIEIYPDVKEIENELDLLTTYYFENRYPGDYPEIGRQETEEAYDAAKIIKEFVLSKIS